MDAYSYKDVLRHLPRFIGFVFRNFSVAYVSTIVTIAGVLIEYAALSLMIPLSSSQGGGESSAMVLKFWEGVAVTLGLPVGAQTWLWLFLLLLGMRIAISFAQTALNTRVAKQIFAFLSASAFSRVVSDIPMSEIYKRTVGHYIALAGDESVRVGMLFFYLAQATAALVAAAIGLGVLYLFSVQAFELTMLFLLGCAIVLGLLTRGVFKLSSEAGKLSKELHTTFLEALNGLRSLRSMAGEQYVADRYRGEIYRYAGVLFRQDTLNQSARTVPGLVLVVVALVVLLPGAHTLRNISVVYFFVVTTMLIRVLSFLGTAVSSAGNAAVNIRAVFELEDILGENDIPQSAHGVTRIANIRQINFSNLDCGYSPRHKILSGAAGQLCAGRSYAVTGKSGTGKSTLCDVLLGLLPPLAGNLQIENLPYSEVDLSSLRRCVVLVEQQTRIFSGTIRENISFGLVLTDETVQAAIDVSGLREFIKDLPLGLETQLEYQGANLSGGQRQRLGLARAIVRQPDVLILDEATSALDIQTRDLVLRNLHELFCDKVLVFVTHDMQVIDTVDEVWRLEKGKLIIEKGRRLA